MKKIIRFVKTLFGQYEPGYEYWIQTKDIKVPYCYKRTKVRHAKWVHKLNHWKQTGRFESPILLHKDFRLADGFSSVKIAYLNKVDKVPVYFVD